ncbi:rRNA accumulation- protein [Spiromyces aspiralis]|uniref:rRNA accumulation- protein n=1 Tax=Spiromyces aspiralis TaxID=68401 RepID=A0ACC1HH01_9FUNG|nr:rRNA accumulation- protein [Spiromyces aspiralis]
MEPPQQQQGATAVQAQGVPAVHPNKAAFIEGIDHVFAKWTALLLAVENGWGGPDSQEKRDWMVDMVVDLFDQKGKNVEPEDIEDRLIQIMSDEFNTVLDDGSAETVSQIIYKLYHECIHGNHSTVDRLLKERTERESKGIGAQTLNQSRAAPDNDADDDDDDDDEEEDGSSDDENSQMQS